MAAVTPKSKKSNVVKPKAFAVSKARLKRSGVSSPKSADWTLYRTSHFVQDLLDTFPALAEIESLDKKVEAILERNGMAKAIHIREETIKYRIRCHQELVELTKEERELLHKLRQVRNRKNHLTDVMGNLRNLLRLPREQEEYESKYKKVSK